MFFNTKNSLKLILFAGSYCSKGHPTYVEPALTMITSMFTTHLCINSKNGCEEELDDKKLEDHEKYCIFQNVPCPVITCTKSIVFQDVQKHLDETHKCLKVDSEWLIHTGEWEFEGTLEEMIQNVCCMSSYGKQFFVQFEKYEKKCFGTWMCGHQCHTRNAHGGCHGYGRGVCDQWHTPESGRCKNSFKGNHILLRVIMLGHQDEVHSFQAIMTYFHENGKKFAVEVDVLPITSGKRGIDSFNAISLEKLTNYYDVKSGDFKTQPIKFTLKIANEKLDEIEKDRNTHVESGLEDSDHNE